MKTTSEKKRNKKKSVSRHVIGEDGAVRYVAHFFRQNFRVEHHSMEAIDVWPLPHFNFYSFFSTAAPVFAAAGGKLNSPHFPPQAKEKWESFFAAPAKFSSYRPFRRRQRRFGPIWTDYIYIYIYASKLYTRYNIWPSAGGTGASNTCWYL